EAWTQSMGRGWRRHHDAIVALDRRELVELLAATWRAHSCSGVGPNPGSFTISEDDEKVTFTIIPAARASGSCETAPTRDCPTAAARARRTTGRSGARGSRCTARTAAS